MAVERSSSLVTARLVAASGAIAEAISHLPLLMQSLSQTPYIGIGFLLLSVAGFLLAQLLIIRDTVAVWLSTVVVATLAVVGYISAAPRVCRDCMTASGNGSIRSGLSRWSARARC